jgi:hypothetical protein
MSSSAQADRLPMELLFGMVLMVPMTSQPT